MRRPHGQRDQDREDVGFELAAKPFHLGLGEFVGIDDGDAVLAQFLIEGMPGRPRLVAHLSDPFPDRRQLLEGRQPVGARGDDAGHHLLLQPGKANHEKLVEIGRGDGEKSHPLEQGMTGILRLLEHPLIERQPGQFAVEETLASQHRRGHGCLAVSRR